MVAITLMVPAEVVYQLAAAIAIHLQKDLHKVAAAVSVGNDKTTFFTVEEVAVKLRRCEKTILKRIKDGLLTAKNDGSLSKPQYRISAADLHAFHKCGRV